MQQKNTQLITTFFFKDLLNGVIFMHRPCQRIPGNPTWLINEKPEKRIQEL